MLSTIFDLNKPERLQHEQAATKRKAQIVRRCEALRLEMLHHPEREDELARILEEREAELRKMGGG